MSKSDCEVQTFELFWQVRILSLHFFLRWVFERFPLYETHRIWFTYVGNRTENHLVCHGIDMICGQGSLAVLKGALQEMRPQSSHVIFRH